MDSGLWEFLYVSFLKSFWDSTKNSSNYIHLILDDYFSCLLSPIRCKMLGIHKRILRLDNGVWFWAGYSLTLLHGWRSHLSLAPKFHSIIHKDGFVPLSNSDVWMLFFSSPEDYQSPWVSVLLLCSHVWIHVLSEWQQRVVLTLTAHQ